MVGVTTSYLDQAKPLCFKLLSRLVEVEGVTSTASRMCARARARKTDSPNTAESWFALNYPFHLNQLNYFNGLWPELPRTYPGLTPTTTGQVVDYAR
jgi:hypothetical protein